MDSLDLLAEEVGWHVGDGSMNFYKNKSVLKGSYSLRGHIVDDYLHYKERILPIYFKLFSLRLPLHRMFSTGVCGFQIWSDDLVNFKQELGLPLGVKSQINVPSFVIENNNFFVPFIRGLFDTDGCIYIENKRGKAYPRVHITSISFPLMKALKEMALALDLRATVYLQKVYPSNWNNKFIFSVRGHNQVQKWFDLIESKNPKHVKKYDFYINNFDKKIL